MIFTLDESIRSVTTAPFELIERREPTILASAMFSSTSFTYFFQLF